MLKTILRTIVAVPLVLISFCQISSGVWQCPNGQCYDDGKNVTEPYMCGTPGDKNEIFRIGHLLYEQYEWAKLISGKGAAETLGKGKYIEEAAKSWVAMDTNLNISGVSLYNAAAVARINSTNEKKLKGNALKSDHANLAAALKSSDGVWKKLQAGPGLAWTGRGLAVRRAIYLAYGLTPQYLPVTARAALAPVANLRCKYLWKLAASDIKIVDGNWTIADMLVKLPTVIDLHHNNKVLEAQPRYLTLRAWAYPDAGRYEVLVRIHDAFVRKDCQAIRDIGAKAIESVMFSRHAAVLLGACATGKSFPLVSELKVLNKVASKKGYRITAKADLSSQDIKNKKRNLDRIRNNIDAEIKKMSEFKCEGWDSPASMIGQLDYAERVINDPNSNSWYRTFELAKENVINAFGLAEVDCSAQQLGWDSTGIRCQVGDSAEKEACQLSRLLGDGTGLFLNMAKSGLSMYGAGGSSVAGTILVVVDPIAATYNQTHGTCVEYPAHAKILGYSLDGINLVRHISGKMLEAGVIQVYLTLDKEVAKKVLKESTGEIVDLAASKSAVFAIDKMSSGCVKFGEEELAKENEALGDAGAFANASLVSNLFKSVK